MFLGLGFVLWIVDFGFLGFRVSALGFLVLGFGFG